jgi:hypothetical protein
MFLQKVRCLHVSAIRLGRPAFAPFTLAGVHNSRPTKKRAHVHVDRRLRCAREPDKLLGARRADAPAHPRAPLTTHSPPFALHAPESLRMPSACAQALGTPA